jgi:hypothetical protein
LSETVFCTNGRSPRIRAIQHNKKHNSSLGFTTKSVTLLKPLYAYTVVIIITMTTSKRQKTAAKTLPQPKRKFQVETATTEINHGVTTKRLQSRRGRVMHNGRMTEPQKRWSMQVAEGTIDDDVESTEDSSSITSNGEDDGVVIAGNVGVTRRQERSQHREPPVVAKQSKYLVNTNYNDTEEDTEMEDPRRIICELQAKIEALEKTNKEWEEKEKEKSAGYAPPLMLNGGQRAALGKFTNQYIYPKIKFVNDEMLNSSACGIMKDCMNYLGIKNPIESTQIWAACKKRIANVVSQQRYTTTQMMKNKCIGKSWLVEHN